jgi:hypothetical protein
LIEKVNKFFEITNDDEEDSDDESPSQNQESASQISQTQTVLSEEQKECLQIASGLVAVSYTEIFNGKSAIFSKSQSLKTHILL